MRVLQLITDRDRRGAQVFALDLAGGLRRLGVDEETVALAPGTHGDLLPVRALGSKRLAMDTFRELRRAARSFDVVVAHGSSTLPASVLALAGLGAPIVYRQISDPEFWASSWPRRLRVAGLLRGTRAIVALSSDTAATLRRHYWLRRRPAITVIPNAVPEERFHPPTASDRTEARSLLGVPSGSDVVLFIGALTPEKGADLAIASVSGLPSAMLLVVGDGPQRAELERLAARCLPGRFLFAGSLDDPLAAYWSADLLVFPSRGGDSMPAVLIEAGLCGLASVTTDVGAIREVVEHGVTGLVVVPGDGEAISAAVLALMGDPARRSAMATAAVERCTERFTIGRIAVAWLDLLSAVSSPVPAGEPGA